MAEFLVEDPGSHANFRRYAIHVWKRHLRVLEDEIARRISKARRR
jgi:hypothetical protein